MACARSCAVISAKRRMAGRCGLKSSFSSMARPAFSNMETIESAIAGALVNPGEQIPAACTMCGATSLWRRMKSPVEGCARTPAKDVMTARRFRFGTESSAIFFSSARPSSVVSVSSLSSMSFAVGPAKTLSSTVGLTRIPLPILEGVWKTTRVIKLAV